MTGGNGKDPTLADGVRRVLAHRGDGPLRDVLVVELTHSLAGNFAGTLLADFGACVIKAETRDGGDPMRRLGTVPPRERDSLYFQAECRGKYSILFDPPADVPALTALLGASDLLIEDHGPGWLEGHDLDPRVLWRDNPSLGFLRLSAFGQTGPLRDEAGDDRVAQAFAGVTNVTGYPGQPPIPVSVPLAEYWTGLHGANGALIALLEAAGSGRGQVIDLGLYETALRVQEEAVIQHDQLGIVRRRMGNEYAETVPSNHYETADGRWVAISAAGIAPFRRVCEALGVPEAADDPVYSTPDARIQNRALVNELIGGWVGRHTVDEVAERFTAAGAPFAVVKSSAEIAEDPQVLARGNLLDCPSQSGRAGWVLAPVPKLTGHEMSLRGGGPEHGEHDQAVRSVLSRPATSTARSDDGSAPCPACG
jgi:crotonobetainyl-CoA:carnitine CoA-transferase CaiB-like acyl-CoA transferase